MEMLDYPNNMVNPAHTCAARGEAIGLCVVCCYRQHENGQISRFRATRKYDEPVEKFATLCFKLFGKAHECRKHCVGHAYQPHPLVLSAHAHNPEEVGHA